MQVVLLFRTSQLAIYNVMYTETTSSTTLQRVSAQCK